MVAGRSLMCVISWYGWLMIIVIRRVIIDHLLMDHTALMMDGWVWIGEDRSGWHQAITRPDARFVPSQWETVLLCNDVTHWLSANLESALITPTYANPELIPKEWTNLIYKDICVWFVLIFSVWQRVHWPCALCVMIPMHRLWLHDLYGLRGLDVWCPQKAVKLNLSHTPHYAQVRTSASSSCLRRWPCTQ